MHLETIGLLHYTSPFLTDNSRNFDSNTVDIEYYWDHRRFQISAKKQDTGEYVMFLGAVALTKVGRELSKIAGAEPVDGFFDCVEEEWARKGVSRIKI